MTGVPDYSAVGRVASPRVPWIGVGFVVIAPVLGGLPYGPLVSRFAPEARGHGVPEVMLAVSRHGGRIRPSVPAVKALASALCIGTGGSVGREGPIVQIGSALGSVVGQAARVPTSRLRLLVACGAAGGIAATFNAPIAGVFFALEVILGDFASRSFGVVVLSAVVANAIDRAVEGSHSFLNLPTFTLVSPVELGLYAGLGLVAAVVGVGFTRFLYTAEDAADAVWRGPDWLRPAAGGVLLGGVLLLLPQLYGVGYPVLSDAVAGHLAVGLLLALLLGKVVATSLTIAIGGSGGVFAPSLFMGAMLGSALGDGIHGLLPSITAPSGAYALVGMGAVFAAAARAPITAVLIVFELTGEDSVILPLMVAVVVASSVSSALSEDSIYTLKLRRRGIRIDHPRVPSVMQTTVVGEAMLPLPAAVSAATSLDGVLARIAAGGDPVPVVDGDGRLVGVISATEAEAALSDEQPPDAGQLARLPATVHADDSLELAVGVLSRAEDQGAPVLDHGRPVGWIDHGAVLRAYESRRRVLSGDGATAPNASSSEPSLSPS